MKIDVDKRKPELPITIDREKARRYGLSTQNIGFTILHAPREVSSHKNGEDDYPINVRFEESARNNVDALMNQKVIFRSASDGQIKEVPISAVATAERGINVQQRQAERPRPGIITPSSNVLEGANANEIVAQMETALTDLRPPTACGLRLPASQGRAGQGVGVLPRAPCLRCFLIV